MARPSHELKPGEQEAEATAEAVAEAETRKFPGFPFYRSGPNKGQRRYPNPLKAGRTPAQETELAPTPAPLPPDEQRLRRLQHLRDRGLLGPDEGENETPAESPPPATPPTTPSPPPSRSMAPSGPSLPAESKDPETSTDSKSE